MQEIFQVKYPSPSNTPGMTERSQPDFEEERKGIEDRTKLSEPDARRQGSPPRRVGTVKPCTHYGRRNKCGRTGFECNMLIIVEDPDEVQFLPKVSLSTPRFRQHEVMCPYDD